MVVAIPHKVLNLSKTLQEIRFVDWVLDKTPEIRGDRVARREIQERLLDLKTTVAEELGGLFNSRSWGDGAFYWLYRGREVELPRRGGVGALLSDICDHLYNSSPRIRNELINRHSLPSAVVLARKNLVQAMFEHASEPNLGIAGFPPELSIYYSLLQRAGIHRKDGQGNWSFGEPTQDDPSGLRACWDKMTALIFADSEEQIQVDYLIRVLNAPPYGMTVPVLTVILCAMFLEKRDQISLYREGTFVPEPDRSHWELLFRRPDLFAVRGIRIVGERMRVVDRLSRSLRTEARLLDVVRAFVRMFRSLPNYARQTKRLPKEAIAVRESAFNARSPERLLFYDLPRAVGVRPFDEANCDDDAIDGFFGRMNDCLRVLMNETTEVLDRALNQFVEACGLPAGPAGMSQARVRAKEMLYVRVPDDLLPLLGRICEEGTAESIRDSVLAYISGTSPHSWTDLHVERFPAQAAVVGQAFREQWIKARAGSRFRALTGQEIRTSQETARTILGSLSASLNGVDDRILKAAILDLYDLVDRRSERRE